MSKGIELEGFDELLRATEELGRKGGRVENEALRRSADYLVKQVKSNTPIQTGNLRDSIARSNVRTNKGIKNIRVGATKEGFYLKFLEFGTSKMNANPFMSRTFESEKRTAYKILQKQLKIGLGLK